MTSAGISTQNRHPHAAGSASCVRQHENHDDGNGDGDGNRGARSTMVLLLRYSQPLGGHLASLQFWEDVTMHARVIRIKGRPERIDEGIDNFKQKAVPTVKAQDGYAGLRLLVNRDTGESVVVGFWQDEEALRRSGEALSDLRADASSRFGEESPTIEHYEAAIQHRPKPTEEGNWVRLSTLRGDPGKIDAGIRHFESEVIPAVERIDGFRGAILFVDRTTGQALVATVWDSKEHLERSASEAQPIRARAAEAIGATGSPQVESFQVEFAELLAPVTR